MASAFVTLGILATFQTVPVLMDRLELYKSKVCHPFAGKKTQKTSAKTIQTGHNKAHSRRTLCSLKTKTISVRFDPLIKGQSLPRLNPDVKHDISLEAVDSKNLPECSVDHVGIRKQSLDLHTEAWFELLVLISCGFLWLQHIAFTLH